MVLRILDFKKDETIQVFELVGTAKVSREFPYANQHAKQTIEELRKLSKGLRAAAIGKCRASDRPGLDEAAWKKTVDERDRQVDRAVHTRRVPSLGGP